MTKLLPFLFLLFACTSPPPASTCSALGASCYGAYCCAGLTCSPQGFCATESQKTCTHALTCPGNRNVEVCTTSTETYYETTDSTIFTCVLPTNCDVAAKAAAAWCGASPLLTWIVTDNCFDGSSVEYRFFDVNRNLVWPGNGIVYSAEVGKPYESTLACQVGDKICIGADQPGIGSWGVGINGAGTCSDCCYTCTTGGVTYSFECP